MNIPETDIITKDNIHRLEELAWVGDGNVSTLRYTPDGRYLVLGGSLGIWVHDEHQQTRYLFGKDQFEDYVRGFALSGDSQFGAIAKAEGNNPLEYAHTITVWRLADGTVYRTITLYSEFTPITDMRFHPTKPLLIVAINQSDGRIIHKGRIDFINIDTGEIDFTHIHDVGVEKFDMHPHHNTIAIIQKDVQAVLYDLDSNTQTPLPAIPVSDPRVKPEAIMSNYQANIIFHKNGDLLYGYDKTLIVWDMTTHSEKTRFTLPSTISFADWNWGGTQIAVYQNHPKRFISILDMVTGTEITTIHNTIGTFVWHPMVFHPSDKHLLFIEDGRYRTVTDYDLEKNNSSKMPYYGTNPLGGMEENPLVIQLNHHLRQHPQAQYAKIHPQTGFVITAVNIAPMSQMLYPNQSNIRSFEMIYDKRTKRLTVKPTVHVQDGVVISQPEKSYPNWDILGTSGMGRIDLSSDGRWVAIGGGIGHGNFMRGLGFVWDMEQEHLLFYFTCAHHFAGAITHVMITPDDQMAIFVDNEHMMFVWDISTGKLLHQMCIHNTQIFMSDDHKLLMAYSHNGTMRVWGVRKEQ